MPAISSNRQSRAICQLIFLMPKRKRMKAILIFWPQLQLNVLPIRPSTHYKPRFARPWPSAFLPIQEPERAQRLTAMKLPRNWCFHHRFYQPMPPVHHRAGSPPVSNNNGTSRTTAGAAMLRCLSKNASRCWRTSGCRIDSSCFRACGLAKT